MLKGAIGMGKLCLSSYNPVTYVPPVTMAMVVLCNGVGRAAVYVSRFPLHTPLLLLDPELDFKTFLPCSMAACVLFLWICLLSLSV